MFNEIIEALKAAYKKISRVINELINGDYQERPVEVFKNENETQTPTKDPNKTVILSDWRLTIVDGNGKPVYDEPLLFIKESEEDPNLSAPKTIGRYDSEHYGEQNVKYDPEYDINIDRRWKGASNVHRLHAYLIYDLREDVITIYKYPRESKLKDNGLYNSDGIDIEEWTIEDGTVIGLGPCIKMLFTCPGKLVNGGFDQAINDIDEIERPKAGMPDYSDPLPDNWTKK